MHITKKIQTEGINHPQDLVDSPPNTWAGIVNTRKEKKIQHL